jgi:hypothetical protein
MKNRASAIMRPNSTGAWFKVTLKKLPTWPNSLIDELLPLGLQSE